MTVPATAALLLHLVLAAPAAGPLCASLPRAVGGTTIDLAPPLGFVDVCAQDLALCRTLTARYPASVQTIAYFVPASEWAAHAQAPTAPFHRYLIAQFAPGKSAAQLLDVKGFIRSQQADAPPPSQLAEQLRVDGQAGLGVFDDTPDSISFGALSKMPTPAAGAGTNDLLAMSNTALVLKHQLLSLYVYATVGDVKQAGAGGTG